MFDLDAAIDRWVADAIAAEPRLTTHREEIADHLAAMSQELIAEGATASRAFDEAVEAIGSPTDLAGEFGKARGVVATLRRIACADRARSAMTKRQELTIAGAWLVLSLFWAGVMIAVEDGSTWVIMAWLATTYFPLTVIGTVLSRRGGPSPTTR